MGHERQALWRRITPAVRPRARRNQDLSDFEAGADGNRTGSRFAFGPGAGLMRAC